MGQLELTLQSKTVELEDVKAKLELQLSLAQSRETAAEEAAAEQEQELAEIRERLASAEEEMVGPLLAVDKGSVAPEDLRCW